MDLTKSYSFPVLEEKRMDYSDSCSYKVESLPPAGRFDGKRKIIFKHDVEGECWVADLIREGRARFVCIVVLPSTAYRQTFFEIEQEKSVSTRQAISLPDTYESPYFSPMVVYTGENKSIEKVKAKDLGLNDLWNDKEVTLEKGTILARAPWKILHTSGSDLLKMKRNANVKYGFRPEIDANEGGRIVIQASASLYDGMKFNPGPHRDYIHAHMLGAGLAKLQDMDDSERNELTNFKGVKEQLENEGLATWESDSFEPHEAAYFLLPYKPLPLAEED